MEEADEVNGIIVNFDPDAVIPELYPVILLFAFQLVKVGNFMDEFRLLYQPDHVSSSAFQTLVFYLVRILGKAIVNADVHERSFFK